MKNIEINEPFIVSLKHYDTKIEIRKERSDLTLDEVVIMMKGLLQSAGFLESHINKYIKLEE